MDYQILDLLAPRIEKNCLPLLRDGYFKAVAREAMVQVEKALKEKGKIIGDELYGRDLVREIFSSKPGTKLKVRLRVPLGEDMQKQAGHYFASVFSYYRNYVAHDGSRIDEKIANRILIIASELLELIDASELTLMDLRDIDGLVRVGDFGDAERLRTLLTLLDDYHMLESTYDGLFEDLAQNGFDESYLEQAFRLNLVEMHSSQCEAPAAHFSSDGVDTIEWFQLTDLGRNALEAIGTDKRSQPRRPTSGD